MDVAVQVSPHSVALLVCGFLFGTGVMPLAVPEANIRAQLDLLLKPADVTK